MRIETKEQIRQMALRGLGYARIADIVGLPVNTVKSHLQRHPPWWGPEHCQQCGKYIQQNPHRKERKFCSDKCRMAYWNSHQDLVNKKAYYHLTCQHCGKEFTSYGNKNRKYCSRECYAETRRKSD